MSILEIDSDVRRNLLKKFLSPDYTKLFPNGEELCVTLFWN